MEKEDKKNLKVLSKILYILAKIGKICVIIAIPCIVVAMILLGIVMSKLNYEEDTLLFDNEIVARFEEDINGIKITFNDDASKNIYFDVSKDVSSFVPVTKLKDILSNNGKVRIILYVEIIFIFILAILVVTMLLLKKIEMLFKNINELDTPFNNENTLLIKNIGVLMIVNIGILLLSNIIPLMIINIDIINDELYSYSVFEILVVFVIYYIFKYGTLLQDKSKEKIYNEIETN